MLGSIKYVIKSNLLNHCNCFSVQRRPTTKKEKNKKSEPNKRIKNHSIIYNHYSYHSSVSCHHDTDSIRVHNSTLDFTTFIEWRLISRKELYPVAWRRDDGNQTEIDRRQIDGNILVFRRGKVTLSVQLDDLHGLPAFDRICFRNSMNGTCQSSISTLK